MLTATLDRLQNLLSQQFLVAYGLPSLLFAALSLVLYEVALADRIGAEGASLLAWYNALDGVLQAAIGLLGTAIFVTLTFVLALLVPLWRRLLEGRGLPDWIKAPLRAAHRDRLWELQERRRQLAPLKRQLELFPKCSARQIAEARSKAKDHSEDRSKLGEPATLLERAQESLREVWAESDLVQAAVVKLPSALEAVCYAVTLNVSTRKTETEKLIDRLNATAEHVSNRRSAEDIALAKQEVREFPHELLAPTRLGNVADAIRSRVGHVYGMDTDYFWLHLEAVLKDDDSLKAQILDGKARLDAMLLLCFYSGLFTLGWLVLVWSYAASLWLFLGIGLIGPVAMVMFYQLAIESYLALGDSMCSAVDLRRFDLLQALKVVRPTDRDGEMQLWQNLQRSLAYGEPVDRPYDTT